MDLRHLLFKFTVVYTVAGHAAADKLSREFFVPVIDKSDLADLGVAEVETEQNQNPMDEFDEQVHRILDDLTTASSEPNDDVDQHSTNRPPTTGKELLVPSPSCITYPKKSDNQKSGIKKRSRYKLSNTIRDPGGRDLLSQLDDEIQEQEMDKRSRIELLSYLDAAIKNKNIELNLELRHLAKEEEILNITDQDNTETDKSVLAISSNIEQLKKRIKDLDDRIVQLNQMKEERAAQERLIWQDDMNQPPSDAGSGKKVSVPSLDNALVSGMKAAGAHDTSKGRVAAPNAYSRIHGVNPGVVPGIVSGGIAPNLANPNFFAALPGGAVGAGQPSPWWPMWANPQLAGMFRPRWPPYKDNERILPLYQYQPHRRSEISDAIEYKE